MILAFAFVALAGFMLAPWHYWRAAVGEKRKAEIAQWLAGWMLRGLGGPLLLWTMFNSGLVAPPLLPTINSAGLFFHYTGLALLAIGSFWCALTLGWLVVHLFQRIQRRTEFYGIAGLWFAAVLPIAVCIIVPAGWAGIGISLSLWLGR